LEHRVGEVVVKEQLRGEFCLNAARAVPNFEVNMHGSAWIPTRVNRQKRGDPFDIGDLIATQEFLTNRTPHVAVRATGIAVPNVYHRAR
jgi:hypothetical protein